MKSPALLSRFERPNLYPLAIMMHLNPIKSVLWNYVKECGGAIMARIDLGILKPEDNLKPKNDLHLPFMIFRCLSTPKELL